MARVNTLEVIHPWKGWRVFSYAAVAAAGRSNCRSSCSRRSRSMMNSMALRSACRFQRDAYTSVAAHQLKLHHQPMHGAVCLLQIDATATCCLAIGHADLVLT